MNRLSIRSYSNQIKSHAHDFHQLVLPVVGSISIVTERFSGLVSCGDCIIIKRAERHDFKAHEAARFVVADCHALPQKILQADLAKISLTAPILAFIQFVEIQLAHQVNQALEKLTFDLFFELLGQQSCAMKMDKRLDVVIDKISTHLEQNFSLAELASLACLSVTQFKKVFKDSLGCSTSAYVNHLRMQKAKALLTHTDLPISLVAEQIGYAASSAFCRKFKAHYGQSPKNFTM
jgi:transcriptional regulator GlxA family with amidase domain